MTIQSLGTLVTYSSARKTIPARTEFITTANYKQLTQGIAGLLVAGYTVKFVFSESKTAAGTAVGNLAVYCPDLNPRTPLRCYTDRRNVALGARDRGIGAMVLSPRLGSNLKKTTDQVRLSMHFLTHPNDPHITLIQGAETFPLIPDETVSPPAPQAEPANHSALIASKLLRDAFCLNAEELCQAMITANASKDLCYDLLIKKGLTALAMLLRRRSVVLLFSTTDAAKLPSWAKNVDPGLARLTLAEDLQTAKGFLAANREKFENYPDEVQELLFTLEMRMTEAEQLAAR